MEELQDIDVHDQCLSAAGRAHKRELIHFVRGIGRKIYPAKRFR